MISAVGRFSAARTLPGGGRLNEALRGGYALVIHLDRAAPIDGVADASDGLPCCAADPMRDPDVTTLLVRPDGVIAWAGPESDGDGLARSIAGFAGLQLRRSSGIYPAGTVVKVGVEGARPDRR
ncbi:hypothetical protein [Sphingomonas yunnanensis]|uniref:aromatic-ring hydroxylase C-terminal domain-containing protein n=1 Tax=Sphingomonas yunnanensis TaxID=310400 RepID=UPI003CCE7855